MRCSHYRHVLSHSVLCSGQGRYSGALPVPQDSFHQTGYFPFFLAVGMYTSAYITHDWEVLIF